MLVLGRVFWMILLCWLVAPGKLSFAQTPDNVLTPPKAGLAPVQLPTPAQLAQMEAAVREHLQSLQKSAVTWLQEAHTSDSRLSEVYGLLGRLYQAYALMPSAEAAYRNAQCLAPKDYRWAYLLGSIGQAGGRADEALKHYQRAQELRPDYLPTPVNLGQLYWQQNRLDEATNAYQTALKLNGECTAAQYGLGQIALSRRNYAEALKLFKQALSAAPDANRIHYGLALAYRGLGELEQARIHLAQQGTVGVRVTDPLLDALPELARGERLHLIRGRLAFDAGRFVEAAAEYRQAVAAKPESVPARINLGSALTQLGELQNAINEFQTALRYAPENTVAHYNLGVLLVRQNQPEPALTHLRAVLKLQPDDAETRLFLARTLTRTGRLEEASATYAQLVAAQPEPANWPPSLEDALLEWTQLLARTKQHAKAQTELEKAFARAPQRGRVAAALAYLLAANPQLNLRDGARALDLAQRVYQATNTVPHGALVTLALAELGRCQEAAAWQQRLIAMAENAKQAALAAKLKTDLKHYEKAAPACRPNGEVSGATP